VKSNKILTSLNEQKNCQWRIAKRPNGNVMEEDFAYHEADIPSINNGEILLKTLYLNIAPVMRMYMSGDEIAGEHRLDIGDVIHGRGVAEIVQSKHPKYQIGDILHGQIGWQSYKKTKVTEKEKFRRLGDYGISYSVGLSTLGMTGFSAYFGFMSCGNPKENETVVVSGAAGGVGSNVIQLAKMMNCRVIGIAGSSEKCDLIKELGCDEAINYKNENVRDAIEEYCSSGIDIYFDNVGGEILSICLDNLAQNSRIVLCGSISEYLNKEQYSLNNYTKLRKTNSSMRGFFIYNHVDEFDKAEDDLIRWIKDGTITPLEYIYNGFKNMPNALAGIYNGKNSGVALCRVRRGPYDK